MKIVSDRTDNDFFKAQHFVISPIDYTLIQFILACSSLVTCDMAVNKGKTKYINTAIGVIKWYFSFYYSNVYVNALNELH